MHYIEAGSGEPLVLLHGLGSSCQDWEYQIPEFSRRHRVVAPSLRGFGESQITGEPHSVKTWSEDVVALIRYLDLGPVNLLGFSMGGAISFQVAADHPNLLRRLVIVNSQPSFALDHWTKHMMVLTRIAMARTVGMSRLARFVAKRMFPDPEHADTRARMIRRHSTNDRGSYIAAVNALAGWSVADKLSTMDVPTLIVAADNDFTSVDEKRTYAAKMPDARVAVVTDSRHITHIDQADELNRLVLAFLAEASMAQ
ncbi:MAG: alpha/beta fold hydrolase [Gammaproteobacteria bacterium]